MRALPSRRAPAWAILLLALLSHTADAQRAGETRPDGTLGPLPAPALDRAATGAGRAPASLPTHLEAMIGTCELSREDAGRRCELDLSMRNGRNGRALTYPAECRRTLPVLGTVAGWFYLESGVQFVDDNVRPVLAFKARPDGSGLAAKNAGVTYVLVPLRTGAGLLSPVPMADLGSAGPETSAGGDTIANVARARRIPGAEPVLPGDALLPPARAPSEPATEQGPAPGVYALDRFGEKDVCRLELSRSAATGKPVGPLRAARLLPGCRDNGVSVFDPVSWRFANGHMTLKARKGHAINLVATPDGLWRRDPDTGTTFVLRKVE